MVEIVKDQPMAGSPQPFAKLTSDTETWKLMALKKVTRAEMLLKGKLSVDGDVLELQSFMALFDREI